MWEDRVFSRINQRNALTTDRFQLLFDSWPDAAASGSAYAASSQEINDLQAKIYKLEQIQEIHRKGQEADEDDDTLARLKVEIKSREKDIENAKVRSTKALEHMGHLQLKLEKLWELK